MTCLMVRDRQDGMRKLKSIRETPLSLLDGIPSHEGPTGGAIATEPAMMSCSDGSNAASGKNVRRFFCTSLKMKSETVRTRDRFLLSSCVRTYKLLRKLISAGSTGTKASSW